MHKEHEVKTILLVDDSNLLREQVAELLEKYGYQVLAASNGAEGLETLRSDETVDLLVLDIVMPVMNGQTMIGEIRADGRFDDLPILVLTATDHIGMVAQCLRAGADDYLLKPADPRLLYQRVQTLLERNPRNYGRTLCNVVVEVDTGHELYTGELLEFSEGGAGVHLGEPLEKDDLVRLTFTLPREADQVTVGAKVVHCREVEGGYQSGVNFVIIDDGTKIRLRECWEQETAPPEPSRPRPSIPGRSR